jgi:hypothetical protein
MKTNPAETPKRWDGAIGPGTEHWQAVVSPFLIAGCLKKLTPHPSLTPKG